MIPYRNKETQGLFLPENGENTPFCMFMEPNGQTNRKEARAMGETDWIQLSQVMRQLRMRWLQMQQLWQMRKHNKLIVNV